MATRDTGSPRATVNHRLFVPADFYTRRYGLVSHGTLNEASGTRSDSHGSNPLLDVNTVTQAAGKIGNAAQFTAASSESLTCADNANLSTGDVDFWAAAWIWADTLPGGGAIRVIAGKSATASTSHEWDLQVDGTSSKVRFGTGGAAFRTATQSGTITTGQFYFVIGYHDAINDLVAVSVDGGAYATATTSGTAPPDSTSALRVGARNGTPDRFWDGRVDELSFGKSPPLGIAALAAEIRDRLWNNGQGREYPWV